MSKMHVNFAASRCVVDNGRASDLFHERVRIRSETVTREHVSRYGIFNLPVMYPATHRSSLIYGRDLRKKKKTKQNNNLN